jgi:PAS domain S-box-containing protein
VNPGVLLETRELAQRLAEAEATIKALLAGQIDAVVDAKSKTPVLLAKAQEALRSSEERYRTIVETANEGIAILDTESTITFANRRFADMLGYQGDDLLGKSLFHLLPQTAEATAAHRLRAERSRRGISEETEVVYVRKDRSELWTLLKTSPIRDADGRWIGTLAMMTDRTLHRQDEEALRTAEERMRFALTNANVGIWDMDCKAGAVRWSAVLESQYGLQLGTFGGNYEAFVAGIHPEDRESVRSIIGAALKTGGEFSVQHRTIHPDGTVRWLSGAGRVLLGEDGTAVRAVGISQDVTERRTLERQYQQAQKMEAVGQLASGVAHDFNNLLTVILGCSEILASDATVTAEQRDELSEITKAARRAAGLTKQLLAFGRQQVLHAAPLDVNALITDMAGMLRRLIGEEIHIELALGPSLCPALADRGQLEQVVMNLVVNARDAMQGGGSVTILTADVELERSSFHEPEGIEGHYVLLAITDTGEGMTRETKRHLFEPFFTTKERGKGTGLGLSTTYGIVKQSKGYIFVDSELGKGTTFKVYLPCAVDGVAVQAVAPMVTSPVKRASETVLLVEDEISVRRFAKRILEDAGYRVLEAANGDEAETLYAARAGTIDLIVTDVIMPGCGGPELLRRLKVPGPALRVLYMSGYTEQSAAGNAAFDTCLPYVQKPFTAAEFVRRVREALDR